MKSKFLRVAMALVCLTGVLAARDSFRGRAAGAINETPQQPDGLNDRVATLAKTAESLQTQVTALKERLDKSEKENNALAARLKAVRKEIYMDIGRIVSYTNYPFPGNKVISHIHFDEARKEGFVAGLPNGHCTGALEGSIRWMPLELQAKCNAVGQE